MADKPHPDEFFNKVLGDFREANALIEASGAVARLITRTNSNQAIDVDIRAQRVAILQIAHKLIIADRDRTINHALQQYQAYARTV